MSVRKAAVLFVGNVLMLDEGVGYAARELFNETFIVGEEVQLLDVGCMSLDMLPMVNSCDFMLTVDAVDGTDEEPGTVFRYAPDDMARHCGAMQSLHDLKLIDLFDAATLVGYCCEGACVGVQIENMSPEEYTVGLTPKVHAALPLLVETIAAELVAHGFSVTRKSDGAPAAGA